MPKGWSYVDSWACPTDAQMTGYDVCYCSEVGKGLKLTILTMIIFY